MAPRVTPLTWLILSTAALLLLQLSWVEPAAVPSSSSNDTPKSTSSLSLLMPNVQPKQDDTYLCLNTPLDTSKASYIIGFKPKASMEVAHHILLYGCEEPGNTGKPWNCGEMKSRKDTKDRSICKQGETIMYAWAMDAPELHLPNNVGFKVGGSTRINSLVLQIHYKNVSSFLPPLNGKDSSGLILTTTDIPQEKTAGVYLLGTLGSIPAKSTTHMETACAFDEHLTLHPFAFRAHAHTHGQVVSGYRVRNGQWKEIGRVSPQLPQMFYPVTSSGLTVQQGDILAARCTMVNNGRKPINIGSTSKDEMCNFYMMYYVDGDKTVNERACFSPGPPSWDWRTFSGLHPENAPREASIVPDAPVQGMSGMDHVIEENNDEDMLRLINPGHHHRPAPQPDLYESSHLDMYPGADPQYDPNIMSELDPEVMPEFDPVVLPEFNEFGVPEFAPMPELDNSRRPSSGETLAIIADKENGGKGYRKTSDVFKQLNVPNGEGYYKESRQETRYSWNSDDARKAQDRPRSVR